MQDVATEQCETIRAQHAANPFVQWAAAVLAGKPPYPLTGIRLNKDASSMSDGSHRGQGISTRAAVVGDRCSVEVPGMADYVERGRQRTRFEQSRDLRQRSNRCAIKLSLGQARAALLAKDQAVVAADHVGQPVP